MNNTQKLTWLLTCLLIVILVSTHLAMAEADRLWVCPYCTAILNDQVGFDPNLDSWECQHCHSLLISEESEELVTFDPDTAFAGARFPGWYWYCDNCEAFLNIQEGFDDHLDIWVCANCGYENSISDDNTYDNADVYLSHTGKAYLDGDKYIIPPWIYESDEKFAYQNVGEKSGMSFGGYTLGHLYLSGDVYDVSTYCDQAAFDLGYNGVTLGYDYSGELLSNSDWHLVSGSNIGLGAMIIQTSSDGELYNTVASFTDLFSQYPNGASDLYAVTEEQIDAGTFFRVIVLYQTQRNAIENLYQEEVYDFYVCFDYAYAALYSMPEMESMVQLNVKPHEHSKAYQFENSAAVNRMAFGSKSVGSASFFGQVLSANTVTDIPVVAVPSNTFFMLLYNFEGLPNPESSEWELTSDTASQVAGIDLGSEIGSGAVIFQTSVDHDIWYTCDIYTYSFYEYDDVLPYCSFLADENIADGVYYRVISAYRTRRQDGSDYAYRKHPEVYEVYVTIDTTHPSINIWNEEEYDPISGFEVYRAGLPNDIIVNGTLVEDGEQFVENGTYTVTVMTPLGKVDTRTITVENGYDPDEFIDESAMMDIAIPADNAEATNVDYIPAVSDVSDEPVLPASNTSAIDVDQLRGEIELQTHHFAYVQPCSTGTDNGFAKNSPIPADDPHFGWSLGYFTISGFSHKQEDENGNMIFYRVPGESEADDDNIVLRFDLREDIDALRGNGSLRIANDTNSKDEGFQFEGSPFGRGTLLIRRIKPDGSISDPVQYANYLDATKTRSANTGIELNEEGDYEIALDYEIESHGLLNRATYYNYRVYIRFKVRNGNCTVYAFDLGSGSELENGAATDAGFRVDLANSNYLTVVVRRDRLVYGADGTPTLNTSFNEVVNDGKFYTEYGLYTITASILHTGHQTEKQIFVGNQEEYAQYRLAKGD